MTDEDPITCQHCKAVAYVAECGSVGACIGNVFCSQCDTEIEAATGEIALLCGKCDWCKGLMVDGDFVECQHDRHAMRDMARTEGQ